MKPLFEKAKSRRITATVSGLVIASCLLIGGVFAVAELNAYVRAMYRDYVTPIEHLTNIRDAQTNVRALIWKIIVLRNSAGAEESITELENQLHQIDQEWALYYPTGITSPQEAKIAGKLQADFPQYMAIANESIARLATDEYGKTAQWFQQQIPFLESVNRTITQDIQNNTAQAADFTTRNVFLLKTVIWMAGLSIALGLVIAIITMMNLVRQRDMAMRQSEEHLSLADCVFNMSTNGIVVTDDKARITKVNPAFTQLTGYTEQEVLGNQPRLWGSGYQTSTFYQSMWESLKSSGTWEGLLWNRKKSGEIYLQSLSITTIHGDNAATRYMAVYSGLTQHQMDETQHS